MYNVTKTEVRAGSQSRLTQWQWLTTDSQWPFSRCDKSLVTGQVQVRSCYHYITMWNSSEIEHHELNCCARTLNIMNLNWTWYLLDPLLTGPQWTHWSLDSSLDWFKWDNETETETNNERMLLQVFLCMEKLHALAMHACIFYVCSSQITDHINLSLPMRRFCWRTQWRRSTRRVPGNRRSLAFCHLRNSSVLRPTKQYPRFSNGFVMAKKLFLVFFCLPVPSDCLTDCPYWFSSAFLRWSRLSQTIHHCH